MARAQTLGTSAKGQCAWFLHSQASAREEVRVWGGAGGWPSCAPQLNSGTSPSCLSRVLWTSVGKAVTALLAQKLTMHAR